MKERSHKQPNPKNPWSRSYSKDTLEMLKRFDPLTFCLYQGLYALVNARIGQAGYVQTDKGKAPSVRYLSSKTGIDEVTIWRRLRILAEAGYIEQTDKGIKVTRWYFNQGFGMDSREYDRLRKYEAYHEHMERLEWADARASAVKDAVVLLTRGEGVNGQDINQSI